MEKRKNKKRADLTEKLKSGDMRTIRSAIGHIRKEGALEDIPGIIAALRQQERDIIRKEIQTLLCDIRIAGSQEYIINGIKDPINDGIKAELLSVCWESQQDYTQYLEVFISAFLNSGYRPSLEAFTVIEKIFLDYEMPSDKLAQTIEIIKASYPDLSENKRQLALVLLDSLENAGGPE